MAELEVREVAQGAKNEVAQLINQVKMAEAFRNTFIQGLASALVLEGKWTFDFDKLAFVRPKEETPKGPSA
jgi:hypothetical protein